MKVSNLTLDGGVFGSVMRAVGEAEREYLLLNYIAPRLAGVVFNEGIWFDIADEPQDEEVSAGRDSVHEAENHEQDVPCE